MFCSVRLAGLSSLLITVQLAGQVTGATIPETRYRDPASATLASAGFTVLPIVTGLAIAASDPEAGAGVLLFLSGLILGPSIGYFTTGQTGRGFAGFGIRSGVFVGTVLLAYATCPVYCSESEESTATIIAISGLAVTAALAVYDITKVRRKLPEGPAERVTFYPTYVPATKSPGIGIMVAF